MIKYIQKDITTVDKGMIAHGCNCQGRMGSGVALAIKNKWPIVYDTYIKSPTGASMLGQAVCIPVSNDDTLFVTNCYTQEYFGSDGRKYASAQAIEDSLWLAYQWADYHHLDVYMPKIGAGLGGLDWATEVEPVIQYVTSKWDRFDTYICDI